MIDRIFTRSFRPYLWIVGVGSLLYFKTLFYGLTYLDDNVVVLDRFDSLKNIANLWLVFQKQIIPGFGGFYRPVSTIPYILEAQFAAPHLAVYHLTNIVLHLAVACLLFGFLVRLDYARRAALMAALIFTVHPALTFNVVWIPGRIDVLLTIFVLAAFLGFLAYVENGQRRYCFLHLLFFALALFTKEPALLLVLLCPLYILIVMRQKGAFRKVLPVAIGWIAISIGWFLVRQAVLVDPTAVTSGGLFTSLGNPAALLLYFGKAVFPFNLAPLPILRDSSLLYGWAALLLLVGLLCLTRARRYGLIIFGALWFLLFLVPALVFSDPALYTGVALYEHRLYLPLIGLLIMFLETGLFSGLGGLAIVIVFSVITFVHSDIYRDRISFWESAVRGSPHHPMAHRNLGAMYYLAGEPARAELEYVRTLELNPNEPMVHNNLGLIYMERGELRVAETEFLRELALNPNYDNALFNLGLLYARKGQLRAAGALWKKTLAVNPEYSEARRYLRLINGR
jgi:protein O-mannosyl-transferase